MHLDMVIGDKIIDSVKVEAERCKQPGYLEAMQRCLKIKHLDEIAKLSQKPRFYLQVASSMNKGSEAKK